MKRSIIIAFIILAVVIGWILSGQVYNSSNDEESLSENKKYKVNENYNSSDANNTNVSFSVETKIFKLNALENVQRYDITFL